MRNVARVFWISAIIIRDPSLQAFSLVFLSKTVYCNAFLIGCSQIDHISLNILHNTAKYILDWFHCKIIQETTNPSDIILKIQSIANASKYFANKATRHMYRRRRAFPFFVSLRFLSWLCFYILRILFVLSSTFNTLLFITRENNHTRNCNTK